MRVRFEQGYILVISQKLTWFCGLTNGFPKSAKGAAFFPFIFVRSEEFIQPWLINHERTHFRQQLELFFVGAFLLGLLEKAFALLVLRKSFQEAYLWSSGEQEAYLNHHDDAYLARRKPYAQFHHLFHKERFILTGPGQVQLLDPKKAVMD